MIFFLQLFLVICAADQTLTFAAGTVDYVGSSGQIKLTPTGTNKWIKIKWEKIQEHDSAGQVVASINNFASQNFAWLNPVDVEFTTPSGNVANATEVTLEATLDVGGTSVHFAVVTYLVNEDVLIEVDINGTLHEFLAVKNSLKFAIVIQGWPFQNEANTLTFGASLLHQGGNAAEAEQCQADGCTLAFGPGSIFMESTAIVDGVTVNVSHTVSSDLLVEWVFPSFNELYYDPSLKLGLSGASTLQFLMALLLPIVATLF